MYLIWNSRLSSAKHPMKNNDFESDRYSTVTCEYTLCTNSVDCEFAGWPGTRAALSERARAGGVRGLWALTIWPLGGWFPHWLSLFLANNWDLIWEEISKTPMTQLLRSNRFPSLVLKETSLSRVALWRPWVVEVWQWTLSLCECGILTFYFSNRKIKLALGILKVSWTQFWKNRNLYSDWSALHYSNHFNE